MVTISVTNWETSPSGGFQLVYARRQVNYLCLDALLLFEIRIRLLSSERIHRRVSVLLVSFRLPTRRVVAPREHQYGTTHGKNENDRIEQSSYIFHHVLPVRRMISVR
jgi:hypothetical protein